MCQVLRIAKNPKLLVTTVTLILKALQFLYKLDRCFRFCVSGHILDLISSVEANAARLLEMNVKTGKSKVVAEDPQYDVGGVMIHPTTHKLEAVQFVRARREWKLIDQSLAADFAALRQVRDGELSVSSRNLEDTTWIVA